MCGFYAEGISYQYSRVNKNFSTDHVSTRHMKDKCISDSAILGVISFQNSLRPHE